MFSTIQEKEVTFYSWTLIAALIMIVIEYGVYWCNQYSDKPPAALLGKNKGKYSKEVFNFWNWNLGEQIESENYFSSGIKELVCHLSEDGMVYENRENDFGIRIFIIVLEVLWVGGLYVAIYFLFYYSNDLIDKMSSLNSFSELIIPVIFVLINSYCSRILILLTPYEYWRSRKGDQISDLIKYFLPPLIGFYFYALVHFEYMREKSIFREGGLLKPSPYHTCKENQIGVSFLLLGFTQFVLDILITEICNIFNLLVLTKTPFNYSHFGVNVILLNAIFYVTFPLFPYSVFLYLVLIIITFYYQYYNFKFHSIPYNSASHRKVILKS